MILGLDLYDTVTAYPVAFRRLAESVIAGGGQVHIVSAIKRVNAERSARHLKDARIPYTSVQWVYYERHEDMPKLKVPIYKDLGCDIIVDDNEFVVAEARARGLCALHISGISNSPISVRGR